MREEKEAEANGCPDGDKTRGHVSAKENHSQGRNETNRCLLQKEEEEEEVFTDDDQDDEEESAEGEEEEEEGGGGGGRGSTARQERDFSSLRCGLKKKKTVKEREEQDEEEEEDKEDEEFLSLPPFYCLFCTFASRDLGRMYTHMDRRHHCNLADPKGRWHPKRMPADPTSPAHSSSCSTSPRLLLLPPLTSYFRIGLLNFLRSLAPSLQERARRIDEEEGDCEVFPVVLQEFDRLSGDSPCWREEKFLRPVWPDDRLLWEGEAEEEDEEEEEVHGVEKVAKDEEEEARGHSCSRTAGGGGFFPSDGSVVTGEQMKENRREEESQKPHLERRRKEETGQEEEEEEKLDMRSCSLRKKSAEIAQDKNYFAGYAEVYIHREMIRDTARTEAYRNFILNNKEIFCGKVVLDVGCGSSILSLFCAQAGARKVIAVDAAEGIAKIAEKIVKANHFADTIDIVCAKYSCGQHPHHEPIRLWALNVVYSLQLEDVMLVWADDRQERVTTIRRSDLKKMGPTSPQILPNRKVTVDVVVSEWMGYALLFESMLYTVLHARDLYLKPGGLLVPSRAILGLCAAGCGESLNCMRGDLDKPRYALDLSLLHIPDHELFAHAEVRAVSQEKELLSAPHPFCCLDLYRVSRTSIERLRCPFKIDLTSPPVSLSSSFSSSSCCCSSSSALGSAKSHVSLTSLVLYFECLFEPGRPPTTALTTTTTTTSPTPPSPNTASPPPPTRTSDERKNSGGSSSSSVIIPDVYYLDSTNPSTLATAIHHLSLPEEYLRTLFFSNGDALRRGVEEDGRHSDLAGGGVSAAATKKTKPRETEEDRKNSPENAEVALPLSVSDPVSIFGDPAVGTPTSSSDSPSSLCTTSSTCDRTSRSSPSPTACSPPSPSREEKDPCRRAAGKLHHSGVHPPHGDHSRDCSEARVKGKAETSETPSFSSSSSCCVLSTSPFCKETHWKQTIFHLLGPDLRGVRLQPAWAARVSRDLRRGRGAKTCMSEEEDGESRGDGEELFSPTKSGGGGTTSSEEENASPSSPRLPSVDTLQGLISLNPDPEKPRSLVVTIELKDLPFLRDGDGRKEEEEIAPVVVNSFSVS